jgi:catechol 2,3-dioxygenase-like lactoylglutathione lyase family enzyme
MPAQPKRECRNLLYANVFCSCIDRVRYIAIINLIAQPAERRWSWWGRLIFHHSDIDRLHARLADAGYGPDFPPRDAVWGERYFHITDPDGHELSFAWKLRR